MKRPRLTAGQTDFERPFGDNEQLGGKVDLRADIGTRGERIAYDVRFAAAYRFRYSAAGDRRVSARENTQPGEYFMAVSFHLFCIVYHNARRLSIFFNGCVEIREKG